GGSAPAGQRLEPSWQLGKRHLALGAAVQVTQSRHRSGQLVLAQQDSGERADAISPPQAAREVARVAEIDCEAATAEIFGELQRGSFSGVPDRYQRDRARRG